MKSQKNVSNKLKKFDVICIGAGSGGLATALGANAIGLKVAVIDRSKGDFGGECLHDGCVPSKALLHQASIGVSSYEKAIKEVKRIQAEIYREESPQKLKDLGVTTFIGEANFVNNKTLKVGKQLLTAKKIVIATGSSPRTIELENHAKIPVVTNQELFDLKNPTHLLIIGGGPIGCEMAQAFKQLGVMVTLIQRSAGLLEKDIPQAGRLIRRKLEDLGVVVITEGQVTEIDYGGRAHIEVGEDNSHKITAPVSHVLLAIGRVNTYDNLGLENTSVRLDKGKNVIIDKYLQTSVKQIVLAGDATRQPLFSHMAEEHARVLITNWLSPFNFKKPRLRSLPWVTFTDPAVAKFGVTKQDLKTADIKFRILSGTFNHDDRANTDQYQDSEYELYLTKAWYGKEYLIGGTVIAPQAGELVQELALAAEQELSLSAIRNKFYAYPTKSRFWQRVLLQDQQNRLVTPKVKKLLSGWFNLLN